MPSPVAHYALGAASLSPLGLSRRRLAVASLWAAAPDLDALPAAAWTLASPHLGLAADPLRLGARVFGHRGLSHTFLAAALAALVAGLWSRDRRRAAIAGLAWSTHVVFDSLTEWPTRPLWPLSDQAWHWPLFTVLDPLLAAVSLGAVVALLGPPLAERAGWPGPRARRRLRAFGRRWGRPLAAASVGAVLLSAGTVAWAGAATGQAAVLPGPTPRTVGLDRSLDAEAQVWNATTRWLPPLEGTTRPIPYVANHTNQTPPRLVERGECALERLGPYAPVERPTWTVRRDGAAWVLEARDLVRRLADDGGPRIGLELVDGRVREAWMSPGNETAGLRLPLPGALVEGRPCR